MPKRGRPQKFNLERANFALSDAELARRIGCGVKTVSNARRKFAPDTVRRKLNWKRVNWAQPNSTISARLGCMPVTVARERDRRGMPARRTSLPPPSICPSSEFLLASTDWSKSDRQIAAEIGLPVQIIQQFRP